jgi:hypothetical protein
MSDGTSFPGQKAGRRLDYIFNLSPQMSKENLSRFIRQVQLLNLGMLISTAEESYRIVYPGQNPPWMSEKAAAIAAVFEDFERELVQILRQYNQYRNPDQIYALNEEDHQQRRDAFTQYSLEEALYPQYQWISPLYGQDVSWDRLLPVLRGIEGMMLHQGATEKEASIENGQPMRVSVGNQFIKDVDAGKF